MASCPIADAVKQEWRASSSEYLPALEEPIKSSDDDRYVYMTKRDLKNIYNAFSQCEEAREGLLILIDSVKK